MKITPLGLEGILLVELPVFRDARGFFVERFNEHRFAEHGLKLNLVQDNHSRSIPGVLRGLHFQSAPAQGKLVGVVSGAIWDVAVDIRPDSPSFGRSFAIELRDDGRLLWIPAGFAHGFCVLGDAPADVIYKVDAAYNPAGESGIHWADPELAIAWPLRDPIVSGRDEKLGSFADYKRQGHRWHP